MDLFGESQLDLLGVEQKPMVYRADPDEMRLEVETEIPRLEAA